MDSSYSDASQRLSSDSSPPPYYTQNVYSPARSSHFSPSTPSTATRRNERERNRVKLVNKAFSTLRDHVAHGSKGKKISKVETLRSAVDYIKELQKLLQNPDASSSTIRQTLDSFRHENAIPTAQDSRTPSPSVSVDSAYLEQSFRSTATSGSAHCSSLDEARRVSGPSASPQSTISHSPQSFDSTDDALCSQEHARHVRHYAPTEEDLLNFSKWFS